MSKKNTINESVPRIPYTVFTYEDIEIYDIEINYGLIEINYGLIEVMLHNMKYQK